MIELIFSMLGHSRETLSAPRRLLICIDEVSKLTDDVENEWAREADTQKRYWRSLYSLTSAASLNWIRIVLTGFTDSPRDAVAASDVGCKTFNLSMITDSEQQLLSAELLWVHALKNVRFPGLLWTLVKATPGLLGLWAQQINLKPPLINARPRDAIDLTSNFLGAAAAVPWIAVLERRSRANWDVMRPFMIEDEPSRSPRIETQRAARSAEIATWLGTRPALSPFAVAVTVMALRSDPHFLSDPIFLFLNAALKACEQHSEGCASNCPTAWPHSVQSGLKKRIDDLSPLLQQEAALAADAPPLQLPVGGPDVFRGARVEDIGSVFEDFLHYAMALRLQCLLEQGKSEIAATRLFPPAVGVLKRPPNHRRHAAELAIAVSICTNPDEDIARLCTQTGALLLPSSISSILKAGEVDESVSVSRHFEQSTPTPDLNKLRFAYRSVRVVPESSSPSRFPVVLVAPSNDRIVQQALVYDMAANIAGFQPNTFTDKHGGTSIKEVSTCFHDVHTVINLATEAVESNAVLIFKPSDKTNPLCDICMVIPIAQRRAVCFVLVELKDRTNSAFNEKLHDAATKHELMLAPVAVGLQSMHGIEIDQTIYLCCGRNKIVLQP